MSDDLERTILQAFPPQPLGKAAKELRRLAETMGDGSALGQVSVWTNAVEPLLSAATGELPGHIMFLDGDAWRALLPAWMVASLRSGDRAHRLLGSVVATLDPGFTPKAPEVFSERAAGLTAAQRTAVAEFVSWAAQQPVLADDAHSEAEVGRLQSAWPHPSNALSR